MTMEAAADRNDRPRPSALVVAPGPTTNEALRSNQEAGNRNERTRRHQSPDPRPGDAGPGRPDDDIPSGFEHWLGDPDQRRGHGRLMGEAIVQVGPLLLVRRTYEDYCFL